MALLEAPSPPKVRKNARKGEVPWWGDYGPPPHVKWPGVTIEIPAVWSTLHKRWESPDGRYWFDSIEADRACDFFPEMLMHHIGEFAGLPFTLLEYQAKLQTRPLFGWKRADNGERRFRKVFLFIPKGGGKSPWGSGTALYLVACDGEPAAEVYAVAADTKQARIVHDNAKIMVEESPELSGLFEVYRDSIVYPDSRSKLQVLSADAKTKHGFRPYAVIFDEFHAQRDRDLYEALKRSMVKRRQPVMLLITHAGHDDEGICYEEYSYAKAVLHGTIEDETCLPVIFEAQPEDDWTSPDVWRKVNPGHGITVKHDAIEQECREAKSEPRKRNDFLMFHLNRWVNQAVAWIPSDWWDACEREFGDTDVDELVCCAGLDLAQKIDLAAFVIAFRRMIHAPGLPLEVAEKNDGTGEARLKPLELNYEVALLPFFWIPENTMRQHAHQDSVPYFDWLERGLITATEGDIIDYNRIYSDITTKILPRFPLLKEGWIGYDPAFATDIATDLHDRAGLQIFEVLQNYPQLSEPCQIFEALTKAKRVQHTGHRILRNHVENMAIKRDDAGRIRPVKPKRASKHIDGGVAAIMALKGLSMIPTLDREPQILFVGGRA